MMDVCFFFLIWWLYGYIFLSRKGERREHKGDALYLSIYLKTFLIIILMFYLGGEDIFLVFFFFFSASLGFWIFICLIEEEEEEEGL